MLGDWIEAAFTLFRECFEGQQTSRGTWFVDLDSDGGIFGTIEQFSAEEASRRWLPGTNSVAAHVEHLRFGLDLCNTSARGQVPETEWETTWVKQSVSPEEWDELRKHLRTEYDTFLKNLMTVPVPSQESVTAYLSILAHCGYHLGVLRQFARALKSVEHHASVR